MTRTTVTLDVTTARALSRYIGDLEARTPGPRPAEIVGPLSLLHQAIVETIPDDDTD